MSQGPSPQLRLSLFGSPRITRSDGSAITFRSRKHLALLVYLAVEQRHSSTSRDMLLALLWPEANEEAARNNLRVALADVRRGLGEGSFLQTTRHTVQFDSASDHTLDVLAFRELLDASRAHNHESLESCVACLARLEQAVALYRDDFLHGFSLPDSSDFEEWALLVREQLHQAALEALSTLAAAYEQQGDHEAQCRYARRQIALEPWREHAHAQLMRGLWASGQRGAALEQYELCRRILADELGIEPEVEITALAERIRTGDLAGKETSRQADRETRGLASLSSPISLSPRQDWSEAPDIGPLYGRQAEVAQVGQWLLNDRCRLIALLGIGGVGKTALAASAVQAVAAHFEIVFWRSLLNAPPLDEIVRAALQVLSGHSLEELPASLDKQLALLLDYLRRSRCLLILDNLESILEPRQAGAYRDGYAPYGQLIQRLGESRHNSCLLLTSREPPPELTRLEAGALRVLRLSGLNVADGQAMLAACGLPSQSTAASTLVACYSGNPLALKLVAQTVQELFGGDISAFLAAEAPIFDDIRLVLDQQWSRLSALEQQILVWLAIEREPVTLGALRANLIHPPAPRAMLEALRTLQRRSLLEQAGHTSMPAAADQSPRPTFTLQNVIMEYITECLVDDACRAIMSGELDGLDRYALLKAQSKDYVRHSQVRIIVQPIAERLMARLGLAGLEAQLQRLLASLHARLPQVPGYAGGNILNLLLQLKCDLCGYDFTGLSVWQADLRGVTKAAINFRHADLSHCAFTAMFSLTSLCFTAANQLLVAGLVGDALCLWRAADGHLHELFRCSGAGPYPLVFSQDGQLVATCGLDDAAHVLSTASGERLHTLHGHTDRLYTLAFSADRQRLASSSRDGTVRVWDLTSGQLLHTLHAYATGISALAFSTDGTMLAGGGDRVICLWDTGRGQVIRTLLGHRREIECFAFTADDRRLVSGAHDGSIRLWDVGSGETLRTFQGHSQIVRAVVLHPDGYTLASGGADRLVRLWDLRDGQILHTLSDHAYEIAALAFSADGQVLASGSADPAVNLWDTRSGYALDSFRGHGGIIHAVQFSPDGQLLASSAATGLVRLWVIGGQGAVAQGQVMRSLHGHTREVRAVIFSPDGRLLASGGVDQVVQVWDVERGTTLHTFHGHTNTIKALAFHPDGQLLASSGADRTIHLWPLSTAAAHAGQTGRVLRGHTDEISSLAFSPDGRTLLSSSLDHTARLWALDGGQEAQVLTARGCELSGAVFSPDRQLAVATSYDGTVHAWEVESGQRRALWSGREVTAIQVVFSPNGATLACLRSDQEIEIRWASSGAVLQTLRGHRGAFLSLAFSPTQPLLASSGWDGTIRVWDVKTGACLHLLRAPGPYAGMNIAGVTGISAAQKASLRALGAIEAA